MDNKENIQIQQPKLSGSGIQSSMQIKKRIFGDNSNFKPISVIHQKVLFDKQDRLNSFCLDDNLMILILILEDKEQKENINSLFDVLKLQIEFESVTQAKLMQLYLQQIQREFCNQNFEEANKILHKMYRELNILDLQKITNQISQSLDYSKEIQGNDIIILIGFTGAGKSTFIHYLAGSKINQTKTEGGLLHWEPSNQNQSYKNLNLIVSKADAKSETKFVIPIKIRTRDQYQFADDDEYILCDTPGFHDTDGKESEIANLTCITKCISVCSSIKPIVVISEKQISDRGQGIKSIAHVIKKMVKPGENFNQVVQKFQFVFTKYNNSEDKIQLNNKLKNISEHLNAEERNDKELGSVLNCMIQQTSDFKKTAFFDLNLKGYEFLESHIKNRKSIQNPKDIFTCFLTQEAEAVMGNQLKLDFKRIQTALKNRNYLLIQKKLKQLLILKDNIQDLSLINQQWRENNDLINQEINQQIKNVEEFVKQMINSKQINQEQIKKFLDDKLEFIKIKILQEFFSHAETLVKQYEEALERVNLGILEQVKKEQISLQQNNLNEHFKKLVVLSEFNKDQTHIQSFKQIVNQILKKLLNSTKIHLKESKFQNFFDEIQVVIHLVQNLEFMKVCDVQDDIEMLLNEPLKIIINSKWQVIEGLQEQNSEHLQDSLINAHNKAKMIMQQFKNSKLNDQKFKKQINELWSLYNQDLEYQYSTREKRMSYIIKQESNEFKGLKQKIKQLSLISKLSPKLDQKFQGLISLINQKVSKKCLRVKQIIKELALVRGQADLDSKFENIEEVLQVFQECQWVQEYDQEQEFDFQKQETLKYLRKHANQIQGKLQYIEISLDQTEDLVNIEDGNQKMDKLKCFQNQDEQLKIIIQEYESEVRKKFELYIQNVNNFLKEDSYDYWKYEKYYLFLDQCYKFKVYKQEMQNLISKMKDKMAESTEKKEQELRRSIDGLKKIFEISPLTNEDRNLVEKYSKLIYERFDDILKIEKYNTIKSLLKERMSEYLIEFQHKQLKRLQTQIKEGTQKDIHVEQKWIFILQHLKQIDELEHNSQHLSTFSNLLSESHQKNKVNVMNLKNGLEKKLNQNYLPQILATYKQLKESAEQNKQNQENQLILSDLQFQIEYEIKKILMEAQQYTDKLKQIITYSPISSQFKEQIENSNKIVSLYKLYCDYISHFKNYLDIKQFDPYQEVIVSSIQYIIKEGPKKIQMTFQNNNFKESQDQFNFIEEIFKVLKRLNIEQQFEQLSKIQDDCFGELKKKVENLKLDNPRTEQFNLKYICHRLEMVEDEKHRNFSQELKNIYLRKLDDKLNEAKIKPIAQQEQIIKQVQQFLEYIPEDIKSQWQQQIDHTKNGSQTNQEIADMFKNKDFSELNKKQIELKNTEQSKKFNEQLSNFTQNETELAYEQIINNSKQYNKVEKNLQGLMKIAVLSPKEYQQLPKDRLNQALENIYCDQFKQSENQIESILNKTDSPNNFDFQHYCNLNQALLKAKKKMKDDELKDLNQSVESFCIVDSIQKQKEKVQRIMEDQLKLIEADQEDFQSMKHPFIVIYKLQHFDNSYYESLKNIFNKKKDQLEKKTQIMINENINKFKIQKQYEQYYENFQKGLKNAKEIQALAQYINLNPSTLNIMGSLINKLNQIVNQMNQILEKGLKDNILDENVVSNINNVYLHSKYIGEYFPDQGNHLDSDTVQQKLKIKIKQDLKEPVHNGTAQEMDQTTDYLSNLNEISSTYIYMDKVKKECEETINQTLQKYKDEKGAFEKLIILLHRTKYGNQITKNHPLFKGFQISESNNKLQRLNMESILDKMKGYQGINKKDDLDKNKIKDYNKQFLSFYNKYLEKYLTHFDKIDFIDLLKDIQKSVQKIEFQENGIIESTSLGAVPELLAGIFTCWTCLNSKYYFESKSQEYGNQQSFLLKPTSAQLAAIFRLLGIGYSIKYDLMQPNCLAQVLTGEGKSIILAILSCFYALCGFTVKCACYSNQLSVRDYEDFCPLFDKLKLKDLIFYGTFNKVCEQILNDNGDIREQTSNFISSSNIQFKQDSTTNKQVLLIDEVDIFFSKEFFGNNYNIVAPIKDQTIEILLDKIWSEKSKSNFSFNSISQSDQYKKCLEKFADWKELIKEQVMIIIQDFQNVGKLKVEGYIILNDKIYYKNQDQFIDNISYGYRTLYSYYQEYQNNNISEVGLQTQKMFKINCGSFSYSELPKKFLMIKGVTGTLETLCQNQLELIQQSYSINQFTLVPSVYGDSKFTFNQKQDVRVVCQSEYFNKITDEINKKMVKKDQYRAVLVFFSTNEKLIEYQNSQQFTSLTTKFKIQVMTEENTIEERKKIIQDATYQGTITLMTRIFCRGIDFKVFDTTLFQNDGIHVIQTFFSEDKSEEIQAKGRTARQGEDGSYSLILESDTLQGFLNKDEDKNDIKQNSLCYGILDKNRQTNFEINFKNNRQYNENTSITNHNQSEEFLTHLKKANYSKIKQYLLQLNQSPKENITSKTLIVLDATGSMKNLITQTKNTIETTFLCSRDILGQEGLDPQCFLVMICFFRSYNSKWENIFNSTAWENNADKLRSFLQTVQATGGTDPGEAVEVGLWWANQQHLQSPINQVLLLGDQPAHLEDQAQKYRNKFGQNYWDTTPIKELTYYVPECNKLKKQNVPVHTFYLNNQAQNIFQDISNITGGKCAPLDINSADSAKQLTDTLVKQILADIGDKHGCREKLIQAYQAKYS